MFLAEQRATHAPLPSVLGPRWIDSHLTPPWMDQTGDGLKGRDRDCTVGEPIRAAVCGRGFSCNITVPFDSCPRHLLRISGFSLPIVCRWFATSSTVSRLSNRTMSRTRLMLSLVVAVDGRSALPSCVTLMRPFFEFFYPSVDTPLQQNTVPVLCWKSSMYFGPWYTFRPQKTDHWTLLFLGANGKRTGHG